MKYFLSCDWGTSSFRLRLVDANSCGIIAETNSNQGIAATYSLWQQQPNIERFDFYGSYLLQQLSILETISQKVEADIPLIISGMAASAIGMYELPYKKIPVKKSTEELITYIIPANKSFPHQTILVSGLRTENDVMRGEETILAGCNFLNSLNEHLYIFPGTHSKHVVVKDGTVNDFKTYLTGEMFHLLGTKSLLANSIEKNEGNKHLESFIKGVMDAQQGNFLNNIFHVRTNTLLNVLNTKDNYSYLSGLIIGEEVKNLSDKNYETINVVSSASLLELYKIALEAIGLKDQVVCLNADEALIKGHQRILNYIQ